MESLLQDLGGVLRLAAITCEALVCFEAAACAGCRVLLGVSCAWGHGALLCSVRVFAVEVCTSAHDKGPPSTSARVGLLFAMRCQRFLLSSVNHLRYKRA